MEHNGLTETFRKHNLAQSLFRRWRRLYNGEGMEGLKPKYRTVDPEVKRLQQENERLKKIIAKQALEIDFKDELLKKGHWVTRRSAVVFFEGTYDSTTSTITYDTEMELAPGMNQKMRIVYILHDKGHYQWGFYNEQNAKYIKFHEFHFTRVKERWIIYY